VTDFQGHPTIKLDNGQLRLECLADVGPRIVRLFAPNSEENLLAELPSLGLDTEYGRFEFLGGHRLWHAPEAMPRTYAPDQPVAVEELELGLRLAASPEPGTGIAKSMEIQLLPERAALTLQHTLQNHGVWPVELAPWAITMLRLGGVAILPQPDEPTDPDGLLPNRKLVLWPYTDVKDERLQLGNQVYTLKADAALPPCKVGYRNPKNWIAYWLDGLLFVKRFEYEQASVYPDGGCNVEVYCNDRFIELETLGASVQLKPGETASHSEHWELYDSLDQDFIPENLKQKIEQA